MDGRTLEWPQRKSCIFLVNSFGESLNLVPTRWELNLKVLSLVFIVFILTFTQRIYTLSFLILVFWTLEIWCRALQDHHALPLCYSRSHPAWLCGRQLLFSHGEEGLCRCWRQLWPQTSGNHQVSTERKKDQFDNSQFTEIVLIGNNIIKTHNHNVL